MNIMVISDDGVKSIIENISKVKLIILSINIVLKSMIDIHDF